MGDLMPGIPSVPGDETTWASFVDQFETLKKGDMPLSLTNWDSSSTVPAIAAGSAIEFAGAVLRYPAETPIAPTGGTSAGTQYVFVEASGAAFMSEILPIWNNELNGWYTANSTERYTGHMMDWDGADAYTNKTSFITTADGKPPALTTNDGQLRFKIYKGTIAAGSTVSFPKDFIGEIVFFSAVLKGSGTNEIFYCESFLRTSLNPDDGYADAQWNGATNTFEVYGSPSFGIDGQPFTLLVGYTT